MPTLLLYCMMKALSSFLFGIPKQLERPEVTQELLKYWGVHLIPALQWQIHYLRKEGAALVSHGAQSTESMKQ